MRYRAQDRGLYEPPACPGCLRRLEVDWLDVTCFGDLPDQYYMPGLTNCATPGCRYNPSEQAR